MQSVTTNKTASKAFPITVVSVVFVFSCSALLLGFHQTVTATQAGSASSPAPATPATAPVAPVELIEIQKAKVAELEVMQRQREHDLNKLSQRLEEFGDKLDRRVNSPEYMKAVDRAAQQTKAQNR